MYENQTYEAIMSRILGRVVANIDKREGSMIWNSSGPASVEMSILYTALEFILDATFADTAPREYLIRRAAERGVTPKEATKAVFRADFNKTVPIGSRFSLGDLNYVVTERFAEDDTATTVAYRAQCETRGSIGNTLFGALVPIEYIDGLTYARLVDLLIPGEDEEDTEHLRKRYFASLDAQAFGGNVADYQEKVNAISGVGGVKVYRAWQGGGTVRLVIIDSTYAKPSELLVDTVQAAIDPTEHHAEGLGIAPIGHFVTVEGVGESVVNVESRITCREGWVWEDVRSYAEAALDAYFKELAEGWEEATEPLVVRISQIETRLLLCPGVLDVEDTAINGHAANLTLGADEIPVRGAVLADG